MQKHIISYRDGSEAEGYGGGDLSSWTEDDGSATATANAERGGGGASGEATDDTTTTAGQQLFQIAKEIGAIQQDLLEVFLRVFPYLKGPNTTRIYVHVHSISVTVITTLTLHRCFLTEKGVAEVRQDTLGTRRADRHDPRGCGLEIASARKEGG